MAIIFTEEMNSGSHFVGSNSLGISWTRSLREVINWVLRRKDLSSDQHGFPLTVAVTGKRERHTHLWSEWGLCEWETAAIRLIEDDERYMRSILVKISPLVQV